MALSFDGTGGPRGQPYLRKPVPQMQQQQQQQQQGHMGPVPANNGPGPGLSFMNFDLPSGSGSHAPLSHSAYSGSGGYDSFEVEPPLLEGMYNHSTLSTPFINSVLRIMV